MVLLSSCGFLRDQADPSTVGVRGMSPTLEQLYGGTSLAVQDAFVTNLAKRAGIPEGYAWGIRDRNWAVVTEAGIYEVGRQCDQYLDVLFRFNRDQRAARQALTATGAATASILGLAGVAAVPIAITAVAFGLSSALFDASAGSVLFTVEPSALRNIVLQGRKRYLDEIDLEAIDTRPRMLIVLQGYLTQCSPAAIEANVNNAASGADSVASSNPEAARKAATLAAPAAVLLTPKVTRLPAAATAPIPITPPRAPVPATLGPGEQATAEQIRAIQAALCVKVDGDPGPPGSNGETRAAIRTFRSALSPDAGDLITAEVKDAAEKVRLGRSIPACSAQGYMNAFEAGLFLPLTQDQLDSRLRSLVRDINRKIAPKSVDESGGMAALRDGIADLRSQRTPDDPGKALDPSLLQVIKSP